MNLLHLLLRRLMKESPVPPTFEEFIGLLLDKGFDDCQARHIAEHGFREGMMQAAEEQRQDLRRAGLRAQLARSFGEREQ